MISSFGHTHGVYSEVDLVSSSAILAIGSEDDMNRRVCIGAEAVRNPLSI